MSLNLKEIISIEELVSGESLSGKTRERIFPFDIIKIADDRIYRINFIQTVDNYKVFTAVKYIPYDRSKTL
jgi:hypothetical protein